MALAPVFRRVLFAAVGLVFLFLAWTGLSGGVNQLPESETPGQIAQTISQFAFGLFSLLSILTIFRARRWNRMMLAGFAISIAVAAGLASVVWGGTSLAIGIVTGCAFLAVALVIAWLLQVATRSTTMHEIAERRSSRAPDAS